MTVNQTIDLELLKQKSSNKENYTNDIFQSTNQTQGYGSSYGRSTKRSKISFLRDGMFLSFSLKRGISGTTSPTNKKDSYIFCELREFTEDFSSTANQPKDQRFILLNLQSLSKFLLLRPRAYRKNPSELDRIDFLQKYRELSIEERIDSKYLVTITVQPRSDNELAAEKIKSHIDLNPEDILLVKKFMGNCLEEMIGI